MIESEVEESGIVCFGFSFLCELIRRKRKVGLRLAVCSLFFISTAGGDWEVEIPGGGGRVLTELCDKCMDDAWIIQFFKFDT